MCNSAGQSRFKNWLVLGTRWVASSFWSVMAVWQDYKAFVLHFEETKHDNRNKK
jgi:hypothetical protein